MENSKCYFYHVNYDITYSPFGSFAFVKQLKVFKKLLFDKRNYQVVVTFSRIKTFLSVTCVDCSYS
jgi:hypothetical protein